MKPAARKPLNRSERRPYRPKGDEKRGEKSPPPPTTDAAAAGAGSPDAASTDTKPPTSPAVLVGEVPESITGWVMAGLGFLTAQLAQRLLKVTPAESQKAYFSADQARELGPEIQKALNRNLGPYFAADGLMSDDMVVVLAVVGALGANVMSMQRPSDDVIDSTVVPERPPAATPHTPPTQPAGPMTYAPDPSDEPPIVN